MLVIFPDYITEFDTGDWLFQKLSILDVTTSLPPNYTSLLGLFPPVYFNRSWLFCTFLYTRLPQDSVLVLFILTLHVSWRRNQHLFHACCVLGSIPRLSQSLSIQSRFIDGGKLREVKQLAPVATVSKYYRPRIQTGLITLVHFPL